MLLNCWLNSVDEWLGLVKSILLERGWYRLSQGSHSHKDAVRPAALMLLETSRNHHSMIIAIIIIIVTTIFITIMLSQLQVLHREVLP